MNDRIEKDSLGEKKIPAERYWGIHTQRALENFSVTGQKVSPALIRSIAMVKKAACLANAGIDMIDEKISSAICQAAEEIMEGQWDQEFPLEALQGGAGTSTNMNVNEVIANRALEILGFEKGRYEHIHPIEHVNKHQSTNDVYPTALKITAINLLRILAAKIEVLQGAFQQKEKEFAHIVKMGRTEMQEAVPMTMGSEFSAFAEAVARDRWRTFKCEERLRQVNIGGTAVGTGLSAPREYIFLVIEKLRGLSGLNICRGENLVDQSANADCFVEVSGILKAHAANLVKIAGDLRQLNLLNEIDLPQYQTGSSIMPGKINPVICEAVIQAGMRVFANDMVIAEGVSRGSLQINEFLPLIADALINMIEMLIRVNEMFAEYVLQIAADERTALTYVAGAKSIITAFIPQTGYLRAEELLKELEGRNEKNVRAFLDEKLGEELVSKVLSCQNLTALGYRIEQGGK
ncbi:MAG: aspartate ammonia-lyase [Candidatus Omnitrophota bacterium]